MVWLSLSFCYSTLTLSTILAQGIYCLNLSGLRNPGLELSLAEGFPWLAWRAKENPSFGVPVLSRRPLIHHWGGDAVSTRSLLSMDGRSSNTVSPLWIIHFRKRSGLIYNYRESVPVKIDSLSLLVEGKENWTIFFLGHIVEYLKPATKAPHKLEVKIAKSPFISHASLKGKEQFALHPVCAAFGQRGRLQL